MSPEDMRRAAAILGAEGLMRAMCEEPQQAAECRALARLLREQAEAMGWRDIATAPRDGTDVLLQRIDGDGRFICDGFWLPTGNGRWIWAYSILEPTHWQPLPPPPEGGK